MHSPLIMFVACIPIMYSITNKDPINGETILGDPFYTHHNSWISMDIHGYPWILIVLFPIYQPKKWAKIRLLCSTIARRHLRRRWRLAAVVGVRLGRSKWRAPK